MSAIPSRSERERARRGLDLVGIPAPRHPVWGLYRVEKKPKDSATLPTLSLFTCELHQSSSPLTSLCMKRCMHLGLVQGLDYVKPDQLIVGEITEETTE